MNDRANFNLFQQMKTNPLLEDIEPAISPEQWAAKLRYDPRCEFPKHLSADEESLAIDQIYRVFTPTENTVQIAWRMHQLLLKGLIDRDPRLAVNRKRIYEFGEWKNQSINKLPWFPTYASGMMVKGITRQGKSKIVERVLHHFPQCLVRAKNEECGWLELKQLVHLTVPMPSDNSRKGFLLSAFTKIDEVLGTDYTKQYAGGGRTVEVQLVNFLNVLAMHRCALLVIEETQEVNVKGAYGQEFVVFFLRVLNFGIPTVMIGNPRAFEEISRHTQNTARLSEAGSFDLDPVSDWTSAEWSTDLMPAIWGWNTRPETYVSDPKIDELVWSYTGGFPGFLARLRKEALLACFHEGAGRVGRRHIHEAYWSPPMVALHETIEAFVAKDDAGLARLTDMPVDYFRQKWHDERERAAQTDTSASSEAEEGSEEVTDQHPQTGDEGQVAPPKAPRRRSKRKRSAEQPGHETEDLRGPKKRKELASKLKQQEGE